MNNDAPVWCPITKRFWTKNQILNHLWYRLTNDELEMTVSGKKASPRFFDFCKKVQEKSKNG